MNNISYFLKENKVTQGNIFYPVSKNFVDEKGRPVEWEFRRLSPEDTAQMQIKQIVSSVIFPDLYNLELQDSYGVDKPEKLLLALIEDSEYENLSAFVALINRRR